MPRLPVLGVLLVVGALVPGAHLGAQDIAGRRLGPLTLSGEVTGALAPEDTAWFNYTSYDNNAIRRFRLDLTAALSLGPHLQVLADVVSDDLEAPVVRGLYLRVQPGQGEHLRLQFGRVPPAFGVFGRRAYGAANPLVGLPLAYQYLTTLRPDAMPATADDLLRVRGHGWRVRYPVGSPAADGGMPLVDTYEWDTGVEAVAAAGPLRLSAAVTQGTLGHPLFHDDNDGKQVSARLAFVPHPGLAFGLSGARGPYATSELSAALPPGRTLRQQVLGLDAEWSRGYWIVRAEAVLSGWDVAPISAPLLPDRLPARALSLEGVRKLRPGLFAAARVDHLGFGEIQGSTRSAGWDAPVTRAEAGLGWVPWRPLTLRLTWQGNWREEGPEGRTQFLIAQAGVRF